MSIRYFSKWLQDEEKSFAEWRNPWAWLDLNVTDPPPGVIYLKQKPFIFNDASEPTPPENPFWVGQGENLEFDGAVAVDGGSLPFIIRRSTLYIFKFTPIVLLVIGIITNAIQLAICCRLRHRFPAVAFISAIAIADLVCIVLGAGRLSVDRLFSISIDHLHPWSCKIRHFLLASAFDLSAWLVPLGLCELWRPASRLIIYATIMSLLLNLHNLVTRGWQVQGDFGQEPIMNDCGFSFPDARIFWLHVHPIVSVIINVIGPVLTAMMLIMTLSFQGRCYPLASSKKVDPAKKKQPKLLRINLLILFAVLAAVQAILLAPTAVLSAMELFLNTTVHPSMRAFVLFSQLLNCVIKLPFIFLAAPQLCPAVTESSMNIYGEKHPKKVKNKQVKALSPPQNDDGTDSDLADQSGLENEQDHNSLVNGGAGMRNYQNNSGRHYPSYHHQNTNGEVKKAPKKKATKKRNERKYEEVIAIEANEAANEAIDAGKQLAQATSTMSRTNNSTNASTSRPPPQSLSLISTDHFYQPSSHHHHHHRHHHPAMSASTAIIGNPQQGAVQQPMPFPTANNSTSHRHASQIVTTNNSNNINGSSLTAAAVSALQAGSTLPLPPPPPHFQPQAQPQTQLFWLNDGAKAVAQASESGRKIYV